MNLKILLLQHFIIICNFNAFLHPSKKRGGHNHFQTKLQTFRDFANHMGVLDFSHQGPYFTWNNRRGGHLNIQERLDRGMGTPYWLHY